MQRAQYFSLKDVNTYLDTPRDTRILQANNEYTDAPVTSTHEGIPEQYTPLFMIAVVFGVCILYFIYIKILKVVCAYDNDEPADPVEVSRV